MSDPSKRDVENRLNDLEGDDEEEKDTEIELTDEEHRQAFEVIRTLQEEEAAGDVERDERERALEAVNDHA